MAPPVRVRVGHRVRVEVGFGHVNRIMFRARATIRASGRVSVRAAIRVRIRASVGVSISITLNIRVKARHVF